MTENDRMSTGELRELYRELVLDHAKKPRHFGKLGHATHSADGLNPLCGDKLRLYLAIDDSNAISDAAFEGSGCAISVASASLMTDLVIGLTTAEAQEKVHQLTATLTGKADARYPLGKLHALEGVREFPARVKCATLAWHALDAAIRQNHEPATTE